MKTQQNFWLILGASLLVVIAAMLYLHYPLAYNQSLYHYQGLVFLDGGIPYVDFVEKKGPMGLLGYGLAAVLFGPSPMAYRAFDLLIQGGVFVLLYLILKRKSGTWISLSIPSIWFIHSLLDGPGNTADVTNLMTLSLVASFYLLTGKLNSYTFFIVGILMGMACWVKPTAIIMFSPIWYLAYRSSNERTNKAFFKESLKILGGASLVSFLFLSYLMLSKSLIGFWETVVLDILLNYVAGSNRLSFGTLIRVGSTLLIGPILRIVGSASLVVFVKNKLTFTAFLFFIAIAMSIIIEGRFFPYHFSPLWPFAAIGLYAFMQDFLQRYSSSKFIRKGLLVPFVYIMLCIPMISVGLDFYRAGFIPFGEFNRAELFKLPDFIKMYESRQELVNYLKNQTEPSQSIYVIGVDPNVYIDIQKATKCRFIRDFTIFTEGLQVKNKPPHLVKWSNEMITFLLEGKPDLLAVDSQMPGGEFLPEFKKTLDSLLISYYSQGIVLGQYRLYVKK